MIKKIVLLVIALAVLKYGLAIVYFAVATGGEDITISYGNPVYYDVVTFSGYDEADDGLREMASASNVRAFKAIEDERNRERCVNKITRNWVRVIDGREVIGLDKQEDIDLEDKVHPETCKVKD